MDQLNIPEAIAWLTGGLVFGYFVQPIAAEIWAMVCDMLRAVLRR